MSQEDSVMEQLKNKAKEYAERIFSDLQSVCEEGSEKRIITGDSLAFKEDLVKSGNWDNFKNNIANSKELKSIFVHLIYKTKLAKLLEESNKQDGKKLSKWELVTGHKLKK